MSKLRDSGFHATLRIEPCLKNLNQLGQHSNESFLHVRGSGYKTNELIAVLIWYFYYVQLCGCCLFVGVGSGLYAPHQLFEIVFLWAAAALLVIAVHTAFRETAVFAVATAAAVRTDHEDRFWCLELAPKLFACVLKRHTQMFVKVHTIWYEVPD
jgi:hypothetical protein